MILADKFVKFLVEFEITEKQLLGLLLVYSKRPDVIDIYKKYNKTEKLFNAEDKEVLRKKGLIVKSKTGVDIVSDLFLGIFVDKDEATNQIFYEYPISLESNGVTIPLKAMDRNIFANLYMVAIMGSLAEHKEVLEDIKFGVKNDMLNIGIEKFVKSKYWLNLRKLRLENKVKITTKTEIDNNF